MVEQKYISYRKIARELKIQKGDLVLLTSDILKLAIKSRKSEKEFDVNAFLDSFLEVLGQEGTLLIPAYNFDLEGGDAYSHTETLPMTGSLAVAAMKRNDFIRTSHPLHSFFVCGRDALPLSDMKNVSSFGPDSPFAYLMENNALMIFAGTTVAEAMTFKHFVEEAEQVWYRKYRKIEIKYTDEQNNVSDRLYKLYRKKPGWTMNLQRIEKVLSENTLITSLINGISFSSIRCNDVFETISEDIRENNAASIASFSISLYIRDIIKEVLRRFNIFRTTYGKIRSGKRIH